MAQVSSIATGEAATATQGRSIALVYSSGAIGRLMSDDVIGLVEHVRERRARVPAA